MLSGLAASMHADKETPSRDSPPAQPTPVQVTSPDPPTNSSLRPKRPRNNAEMSPVVAVLQNLAVKSPLLPETVKAKSPSMNALPTIVEQDQAMSESSEPAEQVVEGEQDAMAVSAPTSPLPDHPQDLGANVPEELFPAVPPPIAAPVPNPFHSSIAYAAVPPGGQPCIHWCDPHGAYDNVPALTADRYRQHAATSVGVMLFDTGSAAPDNARPRADQIRHIVQLLTGALNTEVSVPAAASAPANSRPGVDTKQPPFIHRLFNISEELRAFLLEGGCFSTTKWSAHFFDLAPATPSFLFGMRNFTTTQEHAIRAHIISVWQNSDLIHILPPLLALNRVLVGGDLLALTAGYIQSVRLETLLTKDTGNVPSPTINVYTTPFTDDPDTWRTVRGYLMGLDYSLNPDVGEYIRIAPIMKCTGCHADDHPRGLCPFLTMPGWKGPPPPSAMPLTTATAPAYTTAAPPAAPITPFVTAPFNGHPRGMPRGGRGWQTRGMDRGRGFRGGRGRG